MASNSHTINNGTGDVTTLVDAWTGNETGNSVTLYVRTRTHGNSSYGPWGYGVVGQSGYTGNGANWAEAGRGVLNYGDTVVDGTKSWTVNKTHSGWTANCWAKIWGETVNGYGAYGSSDDVRCDVWIPATTSYTVSYNANNGSGAPGNQTKWYNETLTLSSTKPTRSGYTFVGWNTSSTASTASYKAGGSYTSNSAVTLYAVWAINMYVVKYDANGGSGAPSSQMKTYGKTLTLSSTKPTRTGYTFQGWATSKTSSVAYAAGASYTNNAAVTLYAVWKAITCTIAYNANGGSGAPSSQTKTYGKTLTLSSTKPTMSGYTFQGWATSASGSVAYGAGSSYTNNNFTNGSTITLYAVWSQIPILLIAYDANGGSGAPDNQTHTKNTTSRISTTKPTRVGYSFLGWSTGKAATTAMYFSGDKYINNSFESGDTITLYAVYIKEHPNVYFNVPDEKSISAVYVNVPSGKSLSAIYYNVDDLLLQSADGALIVDSGGNYIMVKDSA